MHEQLHTDKLWAEEYDQFVRNVSFARADEVFMFDAALAAVSTSSIPDQTITSWTDGANSSNARKLMIV